MSRPPSTALANPDILRGALLDSLKKLAPRHQLRNPVMFVVFVGSFLTTAIALQSLNSFAAWISVWLWFTVLFGNFAEAIAEGRGKAQASNLRASRKSVLANKLSAPNRTAPVTPTPSDNLRKDDIVLVQAGDYIPMDGEVLEGAATVDESAITGESAPVIRESGGDRSSVTGGTRVLSDWLIVRITSQPGETFMDRMIGLVEGAKRQKTPNEIALTMLLASLTIVFLLATVTLQPFSAFAVAEAKSGLPVSVVVLVALLVCLIPTTIGALLSAIGIAGMDRMLQANVIAMSGRAVEAAGDVDILLLDKTGTITLGNRQAVAFLPSPGITEQELADAAQLSSLADETPEGRSVVVLAKEKFNLRERNLAATGATFIPFSARTRMSGVDLNGEQIRKGSIDSISTHLAAQNAPLPDATRRQAEDIARSGGTPLIVSSGTRSMGIIHLKDIVKGGIKERFGDLRAAGIKTIMITGDNPLTAESCPIQDEPEGESDSNTR